MSDYDLRGYWDVPRLYACPCGQRYELFARTFHDSPWAPCHPAEKLTDVTPPPTELDGPQP